MGIHARILDRPLLLPAAALAGMLTALASFATTEDVADSQDLESEAQAIETLMEDVRAYRKAVAEAETSSGAYADDLSEQLLGLGLALQRNGDHPAAIDAFKRGVHLSRINDGLYSDRQVALLQGEIASHVAMGAFTEADERQRYLFRVQAKTLSDVTRGQALMQHALWQRKAYEAGVGEDPFNRLLRMWSLYRLALTEYARLEGDTSPALLPPLYGMLRSQYLISGFVGEQSTGKYRTRGAFSDEESRQMAYRGESFKQGSAVIRAIYDLHLSEEDPNDAESARIMLMLGDWEFWHGKRNDALQTYAQLYRELDANEAAQALRESLFARPAPLPGLEGVRALPPHTAEREGRLLLEFGVSERGRVVDLVRLDTVAMNDEKASAIMRRLRQTLFRPRISDGMPVKTEGLRFAYDTAQW